MAKVTVPVEFTPVDTRKIEASLAQIKAKAKGVNFGGGAQSIDKLSRPLGKITGQASEFQKSLEASNARVLAFGASVAVINKLSQAFGALVSNTIKVEATFAKINTILGGTQEQLKQFGNGIFAVAQQTGTSFDQVADGALELARQGLSVEESLNRVGTALKLVRVAGIDSEKAVAGLTAAIKGFEGAGLTVTQVADKLAEVDTKFAVSTDDLINGLTRASASARVAGVSFDELLGVITTVQERTQRGGAVIGNAFKTIFARLGRTDTLLQLQELGISVVDTEGNVRGAIPIFKDLAKELNSLGLKSEEAGDIIQKVAGVRQRDILINLVEDLNSSQSQFAKSLQVSAGAAGALDAKNTKLNETLESLINNLTVGGQKLASVLGELGFTDAAKDIIKTFSTVVSTITDTLQGDSIGAKFAQGLIKGVGSILTGPGLGLVGAIFLKLFADLARFGAASLKDLLGINKAAQQQKTLQQSILQTLLQNEDIQLQLLKHEGNRVVQEQILLKLYNDQAAALARVQKAAASVTPGLFGAGLRGGESGVKPKGRAAGGYIGAESRDVSRGVGGAPASAKVVSIPNFAFGGGKRGTMVANTSEYVVPNYAGGGDAIFNQDMVKTMGLPAGAKKLNAAGGFIPNFAAATQGFATFMRSKGLTPRSVGSTSFDRAYKPGGKYREEYDALNPTQKRNIIKREEQKTQLNKSVGKDGVPDFGILYSDALGGTPAVNIANNKDLIKAIPVDTEPPNKLYSDIRKTMVRSAIDFASTLGFSPDIINDSKFARIADKNLNPGAVEGAFGSVFEAAFQGALGIDQKSNAIFDLPNPGAIQKLISKGKSSGVIKGLGGSLQGLQAVDVKNALNKPNLNSISSKIKNYRKASSGYIPNFAGGALGEAVAREQAAGLPINQIRINQSGKLRNSQNPQGLAVTNTRDEPTGAIPNFAAKKDTGGSFDASITSLFALQLAVGGLTSAIVEQEGAMSKLSSGVTSAVNTLITLSVIGAKPLGGLSLKGGPIKGVKTFLKTVKGAGGALSKLKLLAGPVALAFTAIDTALKVFLGKGVFDLVGDGLVKLGFMLSEETKKAQKSLSEFSSSIADKDLKQTASTIKQQAQKAQKERQVKDQVKAAAPFIASKSEIGVTRKAPRFTSALNQNFITGKKGGEKTFDVGEDIVSSISGIYGKDLSPENIQKQFKSIDKSTAEGLSRVFEANKRLFEDSIQSAASSGDKNAATVATQQLKIYFTDFLNTLSSAENAALERKKKALEGQFKSGTLLSSERASGILDRSTESRRSSVEGSFREKTSGAQRKLSLGEFSTQTEKAGLEETVKIAEKQRTLDLSRLEASKSIKAEILEQITSASQLTGITEEQFQKSVASLSLSELEGKSRAQLLEKAKELGIASSKEQENFAQSALLTLQQLQNQKDDLSEILELETNIAATEAGRIDILDSINRAAETRIRNAEKESDLTQIETDKQIALNQLKLSNTASFLAPQETRDIEFEIKSLEIAQKKKEIEDQITLSAEAQADIIEKIETLKSDGLSNSDEQIMNLEEQRTELEATHEVLLANKAATDEITAAQQKLNEEMKKKPSFFSGLKAGRQSLEKTTDSFLKDIGEEAPQKLASGLSTAMMEGITGAKDIGDALSDAGRNFLGFMAEAFMQQAAMQAVQGAMGFIPGFASGGEVQRYASGGSVSQSRGGGVSGFGTDTVPAMLTPGEFVMKKDSVDKYGASFLSSLNEGLMPMGKFQNGGSVSPISTQPAPSAAGNLVTNNSDFTFNIEKGNAKEDGGSEENGQNADFSRKIRSAVTSIIQEESRRGGSLGYLYK